MYIYICFYVHYIYIYTYVKIILYSYVNTISDVAPWNSPPWGILRLPRLRLRRTGRSGMDFWAAGFLKWGNPQL
jgi:hypothetical protein